MQGHWMPNIKNGTQNSTGGGGGFEWTFIYYAWQLDDIKGMRNQIY